MQDTKAKSLKRRILVAGDEQPYWSRGKSREEIVHSDETKNITFMDWVAEQWGQYVCSSPSTKVLHALNIYPGANLFKKISRVKLRYARFKHFDLLKNVWAAIQNAFKSKRLYISKAQSKCTLWTST